MTENPHPVAVKAFGVAAFVGVAGWASLLVLLGWWTFQPVDLPTVTEPIEVLNPGNQVAVNEAVILRLEVSKPVELNPTGSTRFLECQSGNLVTLTASPAVPLPIGTYTLISDSIIVPEKVTAGDTCVAVFAVTYRINPIRDETVRYHSEPFDILPAATDSLGGTA